MCDVVPQPRTVNGTKSKRPPVRLELIDVTQPQPHHSPILYTVLQTTIRWRDNSIILCLAGWLALLLTIVPGSNNWKLATKTVSLGAPRQLWIVETVISYQHWRLETLRVQSEVEIFSFPADWLAAIATTPRWDSFVSFEKLSVKDFHGWSGPDYQNIYLNCHNILSQKGTS